MDVHFASFLNRTWIIKKICERKGINVEHPQPHLFPLEKEKQSKKCFYHYALVSELVQTGISGSTSWSDLHWEGRGNCRKKEHKAREEWWEI